MASCRGTCWLTYGYLKGDHTVMYVTGCQVFLYCSYTTFYWFMTKQKVCFCSFRRSEDLLTSVCAHKGPRTLESNAVFLL